MVQVAAGQRGIAALRLASRTLKLPEKPKNVAPLYPPPVTTLCTLPSRQLLSVPRKASEGWLGMTAPPEEMTSCFLRSLS